MTPAAGAGVRPRRGRLGLVLLAVASLVAGLGDPGVAQDTPRIFEEYISEQSAIIERFTPPPDKGMVAVRLRGLDRPPAGLPGGGVALRSIVPEGVSDSDGTALAPLWADLLGQELTAEVLDSLVVRIDRHYRAQGILIRAYIPDQDFAGGDVRVFVDIDSHIAEVTARGGAAGLMTRLAPYIRRITDLRPVRLQELERILLLVSDISGMDIVAQLSRPDGIGQGGTLALELAFVAIQARVSLDRFGSEDIGPLTIAGSVQGNDLLGAFEGSALSAAFVLLWAADERAARRAVLELRLGRSAAAMAPTNASAAAAAP